MPLYEYRCDPCDRTFEALIRSQSDVPHCPDCGGEAVTKQLSVPAAAQVGGGPRGGDLPLAGAMPGLGGGCGRPQCAGGVCAGLD